MRVCTLHAFNTGPADCSKTIVLSNSNTMVARRGVYNAVSVEAKDAHGNSAIMNLPKLDMVVKQVSIVVYCLCLCMCVRAYMHLYVCACVHVCMHACMCVCMCVCMCACVRVYVRVCVCVCV